MARVRGRALDRIAPRAAPVHAGVGPGAEIAIVTRRSVRAMPAARGGVAGVVGADIAVIAGGGTAARAAPVGAGVLDRAGVTVIARRRVAGVEASRGEITAVIRARIAVVTVRRSTALATACPADVADRAGVAIVARGRVA